MHKEIIGWGRGLPYPPTYTQGNTRGGRRGGRTAETQDPLARYTHNTRRGDGGERSEHVGAVRSTHHTRAERVGWCSTRCTPRGAVLSSGWRSAAEPTRRDPEDSTRVAGERSEPGWCNTKCATQAERSEASGATRSGADHIASDSELVL